MPARKWLQSIESDSHVSTAAAAAGVAPPQWRVIEVCVDQGTGYGDDRWGWALQKYETRTVGRLWWKRKVTGWVTKETRDWQDDKTAQKELLTRAWQTFLAEMRHAG